MIIDIDEGHRWRVVDTAKLAINKSCLSMIANKFKWAQCGAEGQQLVGVLTCFDEFFKKKEEDGEDCRIRQKKRRQLGSVTGPGDAAVALPEHRKGGG